MRVLLLTTKLDRWRDFELGSHEVDVRFARVESGQYVQAELVSFRDYDVFVFADIEPSASWPEGIKAHNPFSDLQSLKGGDTRFLYLMSGSMAALEIVGLWRGQFTRVNPPGAKMTFDDSPLGRALSRDVTHLRFETESPTIPTSVGRAGNGLSIADFDTNSIYMPTVASDRPGPVLARVFGALRDWLPADAGVSVDLEPDLVRSIDDWPALAAKRTAVRELDAELAQLNERRAELGNALAAEARGRSCCGAAAVCS